MKIFNLMQIVPSLHSGGVEQGTIELSNYLASLKIRNFIISNGGNLLSYLNKQYRIITQYVLFIIYINSYLDNIVVCCK